MGFFILDICLTNAYLIYKVYAPLKVVSGHREHEVFKKRLITSLLSRGATLRAYTLDKLPKHRRCAQGAKYPQQCQPRAYGLKSSTKSARTKRSNTRQALKEVLSEKRQQRRSRDVSTGCRVCNVHLCTDRECFSLWHVSLCQNLPQRYIKCRMLYS